MGMKSGDGTTRIDKQSMYMAVTELCRAHAAISEANENIHRLIKSLTEDPEKLSGDRAEAYKDTFDELRRLDTTLAKRIEAFAKTGKNMVVEYALKIDYKFSDRKAMAASETQRNIRKGAALK